MLGETELDGLKLGDSEAEEDEEPALGDELAELDGDNEGDSELDGLSDGLSLLEGEREGLSLEEADGLTDELGDKEGDSLAD